MLMFRPSFPRPLAVALAAAVLALTACAPAGETTETSSSPTVQPSADLSPQPSETLSPATPVETQDPRFDDSPDGIAEDALPPLVPDRGHLREPGYYGDDDEDGAPYPRAHVMEDWIWDAVGQGWALDIVAVTWNIGYIEEPLPAAYLHVVSPEDVRFELRKLPERMWASPRVTSWREEQGTATIWWRDVGADHNAGAGSVVDLRTGDVSDLVMAVYGDTANDYSFVMSNAAGDELWRAESDAGFKYYRWSDGADEDGWVATALVEDEPTADNAVDGIGMMGFTTTLDGDRVLLRRNEDGAGTSMTLLTYDLGADQIEATRFDRLEPRAALKSASFLSDDEIVAWIEYLEDEELREWYSYEARLELGGAGVLTRADGGALWPDHFNEERPHDLYFGEPAPPGANGESCGC